MMMYYVVYPHKYHIATDDGPEEMLSRIENHIRKKRNVVLDMVDFDYRVQRTNEDIDSYLVAIQQLAQDANLVDDHCDECRIKCLDRRLAVRLISGIQDKGAKEKLFREGCIPSKERVVEICSSRENAIKGIAEHVPQDIRATFNEKKLCKETPIVSLCQRCGKKKHIEGQQCFAKNMTCNFCKLKGHLEKVCYKKKNKVRQVDMEDQHAEGDEELDQVNFGRVTICSLNPESTISVKIGLMKTHQCLGMHKAIADTGAQLCVAGPEILNLCQSRNILLPPVAKQMRGFNGQSATCLGRLPVTLENEFYQTNTELHICPGVNTMLLSLKVSKDLGYIRQEYPRIIQPIIETVQSRTLCLEEAATQSQIEVIKQQLMKEYTDVFSCEDHLSVMTGPPMHIYLEKGAIPSKITVARQLPHAARDSIKKRLDEMVSQKIIACVDYPTQWVHPLVPVPKPDGTWRLCVDLSKLNKFVLRPYHPMMTPKQAVELPKGVIIYATVDAKAGYWQMELDEESQDLTTFLTPYGRFKFLRAPMGLASAQDEFCRRSDEALIGMSQYRKVVDDILVYGYTKQDLLNQVVQVLERCRKFQITLNPKKFQFCVEQVDYVGYQISKDGIKSDWKKVEAIQKFPQPKNLTGLQSFMGIVNQFSHFTPKIASAASPLRDLMKPSNVFAWTEEHTNAFNNLKQILLEPPVLAHYDPTLPTMLQTDASRLHGLGYALLQKHDNNWRLIQCGSRFITETEGRYATIELEMLAVVWAVVKKCSVYLKGKKFQLVIDHKPLLPILDSYTLDMIGNPRLQTLKGKLAGYHFETIWKKGKDHCFPDALSRSPISLPTPEECFTKELQESMESNIQYIANVELHAEGFEDVLLNKLEQAALHDTDYQALLRAIENGFTDVKKLPACVKPYWQVKDELSIAGNLALKGAQIIVPSTLRKDIIAELHSSHQGIERTKRRARQTVYWPWINSDIKNAVENCEPCQVYRPSQSKESILSHIIPTRPFMDTSADLFSNGNCHYLVYVDRFSGWPMVFAWRHDPCTQQIIDKLIPTFSIFGIPLKIKTDGGMQFASKVFQEFTKDWGIKQEFSSPHYPQSNGHAEAAVKAMKALIIKTNCKDLLHNISFQKGLMEWRSTPKEHGCSPAQLVFGRSLRTRIPISQSALIKGSPSNFSAARKEKKERENNRYNETAHDLPVLKCGQKVRIQDHVTKKWDKFGNIIQVNPNRRSYLILMEHGRQWWRNRRFIKPINEYADSDISTNTEKNTDQQLHVPDKQRNMSDDNAKPLRRSSRTEKAPDRYQCP